MHGAVPPAPLRLHGLLLSEAQGQIYIYLYLLQSSYIFLSFPYFLHSFSLLLAFSSLNMKYEQDPNQSQQNST